MILILIIIMITTIIIIITIYSTTISFTIIVIISCNIWAATRPGPRPQRYSAKYAAWISLLLAISRYISLYTGGGGERGGGMENN